ncbi:TPA: hypothetical protein N0F65_012554 [Lagenidium giganteum]|uniref:Uncharacterized protein n=1 Tax=Lagenidium giganteum TaxID=4803 RepID=A0AAV2YR87_9STRA|nr:TPA: hypothetical protein N0F65_012554 [Lagenidium giganteum]
MATNESAVTPTNGTTPARPRGRYAKFNGGMDVLLLEAMRNNNPFTAKHGTRLQMWQNIAEIVGDELYKNPEAYSWHTCRDRVTALMKMYADGKHDKLFKHGSVEENARKESILRELNACLARKNSKMFGRSSLPVDVLDKDRVGAGKVGLDTKRRKLNGDGGKDDGPVDSDSFRTRVLELMESKIQFDMEQRIKENELREQEFELQKRFLEYLQSK